MSTQSPAAVVKTVKAAYDRIMTVIGVAIGIVLLAYFFTFAQLIDRGYMGVVWFQAVSAVFMVIGLFMLKRLSFLLLKLIYGRRDAYRPLLAVIGSADLDKDEETLLKRFASDAGSR